MSGAEIVVFASEDVSKSVSVLVVDDSLAERGERFTVSLIPTTDSVVVSTDSGQATVEILDNDSEKWKHIDTLSKCQKPFSLRFLLFLIFSTSC